MESAPDISHQKSWLESNKRKAVGWGYSIGDAALFGDGVVMAMQYARGSDERKNALKGAAAGLLWGIGGGVMARYGNRSVEKQFEALETRLAEYFYKQGITLTPEVLKKAKKEVNKGFFDRLEDFLYQYPTEVLNAVYGLGAAGLIWGGTSKLQGSIRKERALALTESRSPDLWKKAEIGDLGMGITILCGALIGLLVRERPKAELALMGQPKTWLGKIVRRTQTRPMDTVGIFYLLNNIFTTKSAVERYQEGQKNPAIKNVYLFRTTTAATYIFSNLTLRSVSTNEDSSSRMTQLAQEELLTGTSAIILGQPREMQQRMIGQAAQFLSQQKELGFYDHSAATIAEMVTRNLQEYEQKHQSQAAGNSWAGRMPGAAPQPDGILR